MASKRALIMPEIGGRLRAMAGHDLGSYTILSYQTGEVIAALPMQQGDIPMMSALNDKILVVTDQGQKAHFLQSVPNSAQATL